MEIVASVVGTITEYSIKPIGRQLGYLVYYNTNIDSLKNELQNLVNYQVGIQGLVEADTRNLKPILPSVVQWLNDAEKIMEDTRSFLHDQVKENQRCFNFNRLCPDLKSRHQVSRTATKKKLDIDRLLSDGKSFDDRVSYPAPPPPANSMFGGSAQTFESRRSVFDAIMKALVDDNVSIIGVHGMGGVGKTTLVKEVVKEAQKNKLIDEFAMAVVSQTPNVSKIQSEIASMLGLKLDKDESEQLRAGKLHQRLSQDKRSLVFLDDLWVHKSLELSNVGIDELVHRKGCKLILTSRDHNVCRQMNAKEFKIEILSSPEGLAFFEKEVEEVTTIDRQDMKPIVNEIVGKCGGLPIAIKALAKALKGRSKVTWDHALDHLRNSTPEEIEEMSKEVYSVLEFSFSVLAPQKQSFFLLCTLFGEDVDIPIEYLMRYGKGLRIFQDDRGIQAMRNATGALIEDLKASSLLLDGESEDSVRMHDVIRDFAKFTASKGTHKYLVKERHKYLVKERLEEWPSYSQLTDCTAISLLNNKINELPDDLECPSLEIFIFQSSRRFYCENFFAKMVELKVLNMSFTNIPSIPQSVTSLVKLQTLFLENCVIGDRISLIGELKDLKILSFSESDLVELPTEIGQLTKLMILDLKRCDDLRVIPSDLLSRLIRLECLYMPYSFDEWGTGGNATLSELKLLPQLNTLEIRIPDIRLFPKDLLFPNVTRFHVSIANYYSMHTFANLPDGIQMLLKRAQILQVQNQSEEDFIWLTDLTRESFTSLEFIIVNNNDNAIEDVARLQTHMQQALFDTKVSFPSLEQLVLYGLEEPKEIWHRQQCPADSFCKLKKLTIKDSPNVETAFPSIVMQRLQNLEDIYIGNCKSMKEVFVEESTRTIVFPKLLTLALFELPELKRFGRGRIEFPSTKKMVVEDCPKMKTFLGSEVSQPRNTGGPFFNDEVSFPSLEELDLNRLVEPKEIWHRQQCPTDSFCRLKKLRINFCNNVETAFPSIVMQRLQNLERIYIDNCKSMKEVFVEESTRTIVFPKLLTLELKRLPELKRFGRGRIEFPSMKKMIVWDCASEVNQPGNTGGPFFNDEVSFPSLEQLVLYGLEEPKEIWHRQQCPADSFCKLKKLTIKDSPNVETAFPSIVMQRLQNLEDIYIGNCKSMKEVFVEESTRTIVFPKLLTLALFELPELKRFGRGRIEFPSTKKMVVEDCPKMKTFLGSEVSQPRNTGGPFFNDEVSFPSLEELDLNRLVEPKEIWHRQQCPTDSFCRLKKLRINFCNNVETAFPSIVMQRLQNLERIYIDNCKSMKEVFVEESTRTIVFPKLLTLELKRLPELKRFGRGRIEFPSMKKMIVWDCASEVNQPGNTGGPFFNDEVSFPSLEQLVLYGLEEPKEIWHRQQCPADSFCKLKKLTIKDSPNVETAFPSIVMQRLQNLEDIYIGNCKSMKEVFVEESTRTIVFPKLLTLALFELPELKRFGRGRIEFPSTKKMVVEDCPKMKTFLGSEVSQPRNTGGPFFNDEVSFPSLEELDLNRLVEPKEIWHRQQCPTDSFCRLKKLRINFCNNVETAFPSIVMQRLQNLERIYIDNCKSMKEVFVEESTRTIVFPKLLTLELKRLPELKRFGRGRIEFPSMKKMIVWDCASEVNQPGNTGGPFFNDEVSFPSLEELKLVGLVQPKEIWHRQQCPADSFSRLRSLSINGCHNVETGFPSIVMQRLQNLENIYIGNCKSMNEVSDEESTRTIGFPKLFTLELKCLPELKRFGRSRIEFQSTKKMVVKDCPKMKTFLGSEVSQPRNTGGPFFNDEVSFPSLEELVLYGLEEPKEIWHRQQCPTDSFCRLRSLRINGCNNVETAFPSIVMQRLENLEDIYIGNCESMKEVFVEESTRTIVFPKLLTLELRRLPELKRFGRGRIEFPLMKKMVVKECPKMKTFVASEVNQPGNTGGPFFNDEVILPVLEVLSVHNCDGLSTILPSYLLQTMKNLERLSIWNCSNLEEVVKAQEEQGDKLVFPVLHSLSLHNLPKLRSFCSGNYTFECPSLQELELEDCPNMRTFCSGPLVAPKLSDNHLSLLKEKLPEQVYSETSAEAEATEEGAYGQKSKEAEGGASTSYMISRQ